MYSSEYYAENALDDLIEIIKKHSNKCKGKHYIYWEICKSVGFVISNTKLLSLLLNWNRNIKLYDDLSKLFQVEINNQKNSRGYKDEHIKMIV